MKTLLAVIIIVLVSVGLAYTRNQVAGVKDIKDTVTPTSVVIPSLITKTVEVDGKTWGYETLRIEDQKVKLIGNYGVNNNSEEIMSLEKCTSGVNAGFYQENGKPVGGVKILDKIVNKHSSNKLFNGFVGVSNDEHEIGYGWSDKYSYVIQTGPVLINNSQVVALSLAKDKQARRMVAATSRDGTLVYLTIFGDKSVLDGPFLDDTGDVISKISILEKLDIVSAINLDGGTASAWYSPSLTIKEWQPVGSWWCIY
jgi:exopolysaccharide biosynthesis protein